MITLSCYMAPELYKYFTDVPVFISNTFFGILSFFFESFLYNPITHFRVRATMEEKAPISFCRCSFAHWRSRAILLYPVFLRRSLLNYYNMLRNFYLVMCRVARIGVLLFSIKANVYFPRLRKFD